MSKLDENIRNIFKIQELRTRVLFTAALLIVVRIGSHVTLPGVDASVLAESMRNQASNTLFGFYDLFVGGAFSHAAIFALGIMPYISSSIIIQLLGAVVPFFQSCRKRGRTAGRKSPSTPVRHGPHLDSPSMGRQRPPGQPERRRRLRWSRRRCRDSALRSARSSC